MRNTSNIGAKYREKNAGLLKTVLKIKLWRSRTGILHGIKEVESSGEWLLLSTHCGINFKVRNSKNGRGLRQLKNKSFNKPCKKCAVPGWKLEKFGA
ncbi:MAG: pyrrolysine--tRNA(Pyl) ligase small subunit [Coriobacteriia bacterium]|nr:pyrrolysine--tRNA(Pyl) ligase small subunit [Coriobacteriia bacterium]MCL2750651.1 pyrrolysine--tRNA(Pyl) ligase small subunit [Coriobacteriia bacterium]